VCVEFLFMLTPTEAFCVFFAAS